MSGELFHRLLFSCHHQFSWPRRSEDGDYYQLCVNCGIRYRYDWTKMRRVSRIGDAVEEQPGKAPIRKCGTRTGWTPRERRLRHEVTVLVRIADAEDWVEGKSENVSRTGLLFRTEVPLEVGSEVQLRLEMPRELTGESAAEVICQAVVIRVVADGESRKNKQGFLIACAIDGYRFTSQANLPIAG